MILEFPNWLDSSLYSHFIRGYFDGDGNIDKSKHGGRMTIVGTTMFCDVIKRILEERGIECRLRHDELWNEKTCALLITKKSMCKKFFDWIYTDANLYLKRKHDVYISKYCSEENINNTSVDVANQQSNETEKTLSLSA